MLLRRPLREPDAVAGTQVTARDCVVASTPSTARIPRSVSAGTTPRGLMTEPATPRSAAHAQDEEHRRWLEDLRAQYGHPAVTGAPHASYMYLVYTVAATLASRLYRDLEKYHRPADKHHSSYLRPAQCATVAATCLLCLVLHLTASKDEGQANSVLCVQCCEQQGITAHA